LIFTVYLVNDIKLLAYFRDICAFQFPDTNASMAAIWTCEMGATLLPLNGGYWNLMWKKIFDKYAIFVKVLSSAECKTTWQPYKI